MAWDSVGKSLGSVVEERLSNPLISSFLLAWSVINWKFFVILFSKNTVTDTFDLIQRLCFPNLTTLMMKNFVAPLGFSLAYVLIILPFSLLFFKLWKKAQAAIDEVREQYDREQRLPLDKSQELRRKNAQLEGENDELKEAIRIGKADLRAAASQVEELRGSEELLKEAQEMNQQLQEAVEAAQKDAYETTQMFEIAERDSEVRDEQNAELKKDNAELRKQLGAELSNVTPVKGKPSVTMLAALFPAASAVQIEAMLKILDDEQSNRLLELMKKYPGA